MKHGCLPVNRGGANRYGVTLSRVGVLRTVLTVFTRKRESTQRSEAAQLRVVNTDGASVPEASNWSGLQFCSWNARN